MINAHKTDMLAAVITEFGLRTVAYIGSDDDFPDALVQRIGEHEISGPGEGLADAVYLDQWGEDPAGDIGIAMTKVKPGGFLFGSEYLHSNLPVMEAVAQQFNLMYVQVGPAGTWCIQKAQAAEAA